MPLTVEPSQKGDKLFAIALNEPQGGKIVIKTLKEGSREYPGKIRSVTMLGVKKPVSWQRTAEGLEIVFPKNKPCDYAYAFKIEGQG